MVLVRWQGRSQKLPKEGVLRVRKRCRYAPECRFIRVLVKKKANGRGVLTPISHPLWLRRCKVEEIMQGPNGRSHVTGGPEWPPEADSFETLLV